MLDTNIISFAIRGREPVVQRIVAHRPSSLSISAITLAELRFGADRHHSSRLHGLIDTILKDIKVEPFDDLAAIRYGAVAALLAKRGTPIGHADTFIASHALALGATLVTNNTKHFSRVTDLTIVDWSRPIETK